jgi:hypothetical protein
MAAAKERAVEEARAERLARQSKIETGGSFGNGKQQNTMASGIFQRDAAGACELRGYP